MPSGSSATSRSSESRGKPATSSFDRVFCAGGVECGARSEFSRMNQMSSSRPVSLADDEQDLRGDRWGGDAKTPFEPFRESVGVRLPRGDAGRARAMPRDTSSRLSQRKSSAERVLRARGVRVAALSSLTMSDGSIRAMAS